MNRLRRLRRSEAMLRLVTETDVPVRCLIPVYFVVPGEGIRREVPSDSGMIQVSVDQVPVEARKARDGGAQAVMLFGVPAEKGLAAASDPTGLVARAANSLRGSGLVVMADVCLCSYTPDGHCGIWHDGHVDNDLSLPELVKVALTLADAGVDVVSPSDMMDGRIGAIRQALDDHGHPYTLICAYAAKMASAFYGPFRVAAESAPQHGDRRGYQMNPANRREALRETAADALEGADFLLVKPALSNLDLIRDTRERFDLPIVAYQVSGEYAMLREAGKAGRLDFPRAARETLVSMRRAGADMIISYLCEDVWNGKIPL